MAKKKKIGLDTSKIKEYLVTKGERVGLVVAGALSLLLLLFGLMMGMGASSKHSEVKTKASQLIQNVNSYGSSEEGPAQNKTPPGLPEWTQLSARTYPTGPFFDDRTVLDEKLVNPFVLPLVGSLDTEEEKEKYIKIDVVRAPVKVNKFTTGGDAVWTLAGAAAGGGGPGVPGPGVPGPGVPGPGMPGGMPGGQVSTVPLATYIELKRLVVVSAMFPYEKQLEIFQKALRKNSIQEVAMDPKISPKFLGLNVVRCEVENGKPVNWTKLFFKEPESNKMIIDSDWKNFLKKAEFDQTAYQKVYQNVKQGLVTPLPTLAFGSYPKLDLPGINVTEFTSETGMPGEPGGMPPMPGKGSPSGGLPGVPMPPMGGMPGMPGQPMGGGTAGKSDLKPKTLKEIAKLDKNLAKKLEGKFNVFDPFGLDEVATPANSMYPGTPGMPGTPGSPGSPNIPMPPPIKGGTTQPPMGGEPPGMPEGMPPDGMPPGPDMMGGQSIPEHLLVRFVDVDVQPGKTYKYFIQVRMENPNFGKDKKDKVAYPALSEIKELVSPWTETPSQEIEDEFRYYVVDQLEMLAGKGNVIHPVTKDTELKTVRNQSPDTVRNLKDFIPVQIHRWVKEAVHPDTNKQESTGGWAIAERLLVKRGQYLGEIHRKKGTETRVEVQLPIWREDKGPGMFEILPAKGNPKMAQKIAVLEFKGVLVDFSPKNSAPLVVDFKGGDSDYIPTTNRNSVSDKSAIDLLVLSPDGKLLAHNSREDSDPDTDRGVERLERYQLWLNVIETLMKQKASTQPGGEGGLPGTGGP